MALLAVRPGQGTTSSVSSALLSAIPLQWSVTLRSLCIKHPENKSSDESYAASELGRFQGKIWPPFIDWGQNWRCKGKWDPGSHLPVCGSLVLKPTSPSQLFPPQPQHSLCGLWPRCTSITWELFREEQRFLSLSTDSLHENLNFNNIVTHVKVWKVLLWGSGPDTLVRESEFPWTATNTQTAPHHLQSFWSSECGGVGDAAFSTISRVWQMAAGLRTTLRTSRFSTAHCWQSTPSAVGCRMAHHCGGPVPDKPETLKVGTKLRGTLPSSWVLSGWACFHTLVLA